MTAVCMVGGASPRFTTRVNNDVKMIVYLRNHLRWEFGHGNMLGCYMNLRPSCVQFSWFDLLCRWVGSPASLITPSGRVNVEIVRSEFHESDDCAACSDGPWERVDVRVGSTSDSPKELVTYVMEAAGTCCKTIRQNRVNEVGRTYCSDTK